MLAYVRAGRTPHGLRSLRLDTKPDDQTWLIKQRQQQMTSKIAERIDRVIDRFEMIEAEMASGAGGEAYVKLSREYAELEPLVKTGRALREAEAEKAGVEDMLATGGDDKEMTELAEAELAEVSATIARLEKELKVLLLPRDAADDRNVIVEVRAGTGGDEAALFAGDLFRMYQRYASLKGWRVEIMSAADAAMGGYKEITAKISGAGVYARFKFESGVHRVQRVPDTEAQGRIHTSAATVAVLPEAEDVDIQIEDKDIRVDVYRASGPGGQSVNTTDSAVRITHLESGIVVTQQDEKSQHKNRAKAMMVLRARLFEAERQRLADERSAERRGQVGTGDRSERIRTYNYPQGRVSDHRINLTLYKLDQIIEGSGLDEVIEALITDHQAQLLAAQEDGL